MSWGAAIGAAASMAGIDMANDQNAASSAKQMKFQKRMSDTAHQREVGDLRKAGLNPILSANAGASTPGGASYTAESVAPDPELFSNTRVANAQVANTKATTENIKTDTGLKAANTRSAEKSMEIADETKKLIMAQTAKEGQNARTAAQTANLMDKYGEANSIMGLINSGTGSVGNLMGIGNLLKNFTRSGNKTTTQERYSPRGEHTGTTETRIKHD